MKRLTGNELRKMYIQYFVDHGHKQIKGASLVPENDPTVLFTTAGMHPLVPYLLGAKHPMGTRITDVQKCVRTGDIDDVGDDSHATFFEMLGNWSLGDYFKKEAITWSYEFLTSPDYLGIDPSRLAFSVFEGDDSVPRDMESFETWRSLGVPEERIFFLGREHNWWGPAGATGPCGPDTEMFLIMKEPCGPDCSPACSCGAYLEIWNDVFMEYNKTAQGAYEPLAQKNVDTGMGLERTIAVLQGVSSVYETDIYHDIIAKVEEISGKQTTDDEETKKAIRIVADHIRCATFILGDERGMAPGNVDQGYVLRRLIRRAVRFGRKIGFPPQRLWELSQVVLDTYRAVYPELEQNRAFIMEQLTAEVDRFSRTLEQGMREFDRVAKRADGIIDGVTAFHLYDTFGFPVEITQEMAEESGLKVDLDGFEQAFAEHRKKSQAGSSQRFKGGLADTSEITARLHTATHLLLASLKRVLGEDVNQRGSNITPERLRFDFNFPRKMTAEEKQQVEDLVNDAIRRDLPVTVEEMSVDQAKATGATGVFTDRYGEVVKVYSIGDYSKEICGGPHAAHTGELGVFRIQKEESSSQGVRRIKAVLQGE